jgi:hypothetical protein
MILTDQTAVHRKSGVAEWRDLQFASSHADSEVRTLQTRWLLSRTTRQTLPTSHTANLAALGSHNHHGFSHAL